MSVTRTLYTGNILEPSPSFGGTLSSAGSEVVEASTGSSFSEPPNSLSKACTAFEASVGTDGSSMSTLVFFDKSPGQAMALDLASRTDHHGNL